MEKRKIKMFSTFTHHSPVISSAFSADMNNARATAGTAISLCASVLPIV